MEFRTLGQTGLKVSALGFGASSLGGVFHAIDESEGVRTVHAAVDHGINFIDVVPFYGVTKAETVLGRALKEIPRDPLSAGDESGAVRSQCFRFLCGARSREASMKA